MHWITKTSVEPFKPGEAKFLSASIKEGESVEEILQWYKDQWTDGDDIANVENVHVYIMPWHPSTYRFFHDPHTHEILWEPC